MPEPQNPEQAGVVASERVAQPALVEQCPID
jgi:hypothetical protein